MRWGAHPGDLMIVLGDRLRNGRRQTVGSPWSETVADGGERGSLLPRRRGQRGSFVSSRSEWPCRPLLFGKASRC